jgi:hypothetical protein
MDAKYLVAVDEFCSSHDIEISFISSLRESGLIEITTISEGDFIEAEQLKQLEKYMHMHYELDINLEGIETINYLLQRIDSMNDEIRSLRNNLSLYENTGLEE